MSLKILGGRGGVKGIRYDAIPDNFGSDTVSRTTYTFANFDLNEPAPDRYIIACFDTSDSASTWAANSCTINGVSATKVAEIPGTTFNLGMHMFIAKVPTGNTGDIVVTFSEAITDCYLRCGYVYGLTSTTAVDTATAQAAINANSRNVTIDTRVDGISVMFCIPWADVSPDPICTSMSPAEMEFDYSVAAEFMAYGIGITTTVNNTLTFNFNKTCNDITYVAATFV